MEHFLATHQDKKAHFKDKTKLKDPALKFLAALIVHDLAMDLPWDPESFPSLVRGKIGNTRMTYFSEIEKLHNQFLALSKTKREDVKTRFIDDILEVKTAGDGDIDKDCKPVLACAEKLSYTFMNFHQNPIFDTAAMGVFKENLSKHLD